MASIRAHPPNGVFRGPPPSYPQRRMGKHVHTPVTVHALERRQGVPYEVERTVCKTCNRVLAERTLRRAAA